MLIKILFNFNIFIIHQTAKNVNMYKHFICKQFYKIHMIKKAAPAKNTGAVNVISCKVLRRRP